MKMNRRNALIGLGAIATGGGALFGSGAFSQVEANRNVTVEMAGDSSAFLTLQEVDENSGYVSSSGGTLEFNLNGSGAASGSGVNFDAVTYIEPLFEIVNQGSGSVGIRIGTTSNTASGSLKSTKVNGISGVECFESSSGVKIAFYAAQTGDVSGTGNDFGTAPNLSGTNSITQSSWTNNVDLAQDAQVEIGLVVDSTGVTSADTSAGTDLLNEVAVVANSDEG